jgi:hypothetical protein
MVKVFSRLDSAIDPFLQFLYIADILSLTVPLCFLTRTIFGPTFQ